MHLWTGKCGIIKMQSSRFNAISLKIPTAFYMEIPTHPQIHTETQKNTSGTNTLRKKNKAGGVTLSDFKIYRN